MFVRKTMGIHDHEAGGLPCIHPLGRIPCRFGFRCGSDRANPFLVELYRSSEREAKRDCKVDGASVGTSEAKFVTAMFDQMLGTP